METPILIIAFNRPECVKVVFNSIRKAKPSRLYIAIDAPRPSKGLEEKSLCAQVKEVFENIDWDCQVFKLYQDKNQGCKFGPVSAINWFFQHEEFGIILEDDIVPLDSFYLYCEELLIKYKDDKRIGMIAGSNLTSNVCDINDSYTFSNYGHIWGWGTWRRAWTAYDISMKDWNVKKHTNFINAKSDGTPLFSKFWIQFFDYASNYDVDAWDYQWLYSCWANDLLTIVPKHSLIKNIGFGNDATHTQKKPKYIDGMIVREMEYPLSHPEIKIRNLKFDQSVSKEVFNIGIKSIIKGGVRSILKRIID